MDAAFECSTKPTAHLYLPCSAAIRIDSSFIARKTTLPRCPSSTTPGAVEVEVAKPSGSHGLHRKAGRPLLVLIRAGGEHDADAHAVGKRDDRRGAIDAGRNHGSVDFALDATATLALGRGEVFAGVGVEDVGGPGDILESQLANF